MNKTQYAKKQATSAERSRQLSLVGRDIGFLPPIKNPERRIKCSRNLRSFLLTYLPDKYSKPFGTNHLELISALQECILKDGEQVVVAMPRGSGKTTITLGAVLFALAYGWRKYIVVISSTQKEARRLVDNIKKVLQTTGTFSDDFPEIAHPLRLLRGSYNLARGQVYRGEPVNAQLQAEKIRLPSIPGSPSSGSVVSCFGLSSSIRGQNEIIDGKTARPDLVLADDPQKASTAQNALQVEKIENIFFGDVLGLAESGKELSTVITCTVIQKDDLADRFLSDVYPWFRQIRGKALDPMPYNLELWKEYRNILYTQSQEQATNYYRQHQTEMSAGACVTWEADFNAETSPYTDSLEQLMVRWAKNERAFFAELQNEPIPEAGEAVLVPPKQLITKLNGLEKCVCPSNTFRLSAFVDVHADILYWGVMAWKKDYTGFVIDYGVFPEQPGRTYFSKGQGGLKTLQSEFNSGADLALRLGLEVLLVDISKREYLDEDGQFHKIDRVFVDEGWRWEVVESAIKNTRQSNITPSMGRYIGARNRPLDQWHKSPHRYFHYHILEERLEHHKFKTALLDANFWKSLLHQKLSLNPGDIGSITFWGNEPTQHRMIVEHIGGSEIPTTVSALQTVDEWRPRLGKPDNHYFDVIYGCLSAASLLNVTIDGVKTNTKRGKKNELQVPEM